MVRNNPNPGPTVQTTDQRLALLRSFVATAQLSSFGQAAAQQGITASTASRRIAKLERELGVQLLTRTTRSVVLTEAGAVYLQYAERILDALDEADAVVGELGGQPSGTLTVGAPTAWGRVFLGPLIARFMEDHPQVRVDVRLTDARVDLVREQLDLAIRIGRLEDSSLRAHRLAPNTRQILASPSYLERFGVPAHPRDLAKHRCLLYSRLATGPCWIFLRDGETEQIQLQPWLSADDVSVLVAVALAGEGLVMLADFMADPAIAAGLLVPVLSEWTLPTSSVYAIYPSVRWVPPKTRAFVDHLVAAASSGFIAV